MSGNEQKTCVVGSATQNTPIGVIGTENECRLDSGALNRQATKNSLKNAKKKERKRRNLTHRIAFTDDLGNGTYLIMAGCIDKKFETFASQIRSNEGFMNWLRETDKLPKEEVFRVLMLSYANVMKYETKELDKHYAKNNKKWDLWLADVLVYYVYRTAYECGKFMRENPLVRIDKNHNA